MALSDHSQKSIYVYSSHNSVRLCPYCDGENSIEAKTCIICQSELKDGKIVDPTPVFTPPINKPLAAAAEPESTPPTRAAFETRYSRKPPVYSAPISMPVTSVKELKLNKERSSSRIIKYAVFGLVSLALLIVLVSVIKGAIERANYQETYSYYEETSSSYDNDHSNSDSKATEIEDHYKNGVRYKESGDYENAINEFKLAGDYKDAKDEINKLYISLGDSAISNGQIDKAIEYYDLVSREYDISDKVTYAKGIKAYNEQRYVDALKFFNEIAYYSNVSAWIEESQYNYAVQLLNTGKYEEAVSQLKLHETERFRSLRKEAEYLYVKAHKNNDDTLTYSYLKDLKSAKYKDSAKIYKNLYAWHVKVIGANYSKKSLKKLSKVSDKKHVYFHIKITGGPPDGILYIKKYKVYWPGEGAYWDTNKCNTWYQDGETGYFGYFWWTQPGKHNVGKMKIKFYDKNGKLVGSGSVKVVH